ncbi:MAG: shikimate kinase [Armatimonadota bacterium]|nr:shikimate kinase [Armatimonadota bacterium]
MKRMGNLLLIGARGCGKSVVGRRTAALLGPAWRFVEMDRALVDRLGMPIAEFFARHGENAFRAAESALLDEIARGARQVVACGGGVGATPFSLDAARAAGTVVWLDTPEHELIARRLADPNEPARPPLLPELAALKAADLAAYLHVEVPSVLARRRGCYAGAHYVVATTGLDVDRLASIVAELALAHAPEDA